MLRRSALKLMASSALLGQIPVTGREGLSEAHVKWVAESLKRMEWVKPGATRKELLEIFTTEGGLSTALWRTYVSKDCPYFKVDVEFRAVGRAQRDVDGAVTLEEDERDVITKISRPYLEFSIMD